MISIALMVLAVSTAYGARPVKVSVKNCTRNTDEGLIELLGVTPTNDIVVGQNFTIFGNGIAQVGMSSVACPRCACCVCHCADIPDGFFNATAKWEGVPIFHTSGDACQPVTIKLPLDVGEIWYGGCKCPVPKGYDLPITVVSQVHESAPDATVYITLTVTDTQTKDEVLCVDITVDIGTLDLAEE